MNVNPAGVQKIIFDVEERNLRVSDVNDDLDVDNESGEIVISRVKGKMDVQDTSGQIRAKYTGGLRIRDTSGDITVRRAASLDVTANESGRIAAGEIVGPVNISAGFKVLGLRKKP